MSKWNKISSIALSLSLMPAFSFAEVTLSLPDSIELLAVNAQDPKIEEGSFFSSKRDVILADGVSQLVFQYRPSFEVGDGLETVYGPIVIAKIEAKDTAITFELPKYRDVRSAQSKIKNQNNTN